MIKMIAFLISGVIVPLVTIFINMLHYCIFFWYGICKCYLKGVFGMRVLEIKEKDNMITIKLNKPVESVLYYLWKNKDKYNIRTYIDRQTDGIFIYYKDDTYICITPYEQEQLHKMIPVTFRRVA